MNVSRFVRFLFDGARPMIVFMIVTGLVAGLSSVGLLAIINRLLSHSDAVPRNLAAAFIGLVVLKVCANWLSQLLLVKFARRPFWISGFVCAGKCFARHSGRLSAMGRHNFSRH